MSWKYEETETTTNPARPVPAAGSGRVGGEGDDESEEEMRHEIMLPVELNTDAVEQKLERDAYEEVVGRIFAECVKALPKKYSGGWGARETETDWLQFVENAADRFLEENREEIVEAAAARLERRMMRTKAFKEATARVVGDAE